MNLPEPQAPTRVIDVRRLKTAVQTLDEAIRELDEDPTMERAMHVAVAEDVLRGMW